MMRPLTLLCSPACCLHRAVKLLDILVIWAMGSKSSLIPLTAGVPQPCSLFPSGTSTLTINETVLLSLSPLLSCVHGIHPHCHSLQSGGILKLPVLYQQFLFLLLLLMMLFYLYLGSRFTIIIINNSLVEI